MDPRIINQSQQVQAAIFSPPALYSRVIGINVTIGAGAGWVGETTPPIGMDCWLWQIKITRLALTDSIANYTTFELMTGTTKINSVNDFANWDRIITIQNEGGATLTQKVTDGINNLEWNMSRLYTGKTRRFGLLAKRTGAGSDQFEVTFQISEG